MARPDLSYLKSVFLFLIGVPLGLLTGLTAISGSVFGVPAVRKLLGLRPARAVGVGLTLAFYAAVAGILSYAQHSDILFWLALLLFVFQTLGALIAERLLRTQPRLERLTTVWGSLVIAGGVVMLAHGFGFLHKPHLPFAITSHRIEFYGLAALLAAAVGLVSRVFGLGGVLIVPAAIYGLGLTPHVAQGTALVVLAVASLPGVLAYARRGDWESQSATWLSAGAALGAMTGALVAVTDLTDAALLVLFGTVLAVLGMQMLWRKGTAFDSAEPTAKPKLPVVPEPPLVSPAAVSESTSQATVESAEAPPNPINEDEKETPEIKSN